MTQSSEKTGYIVIRVSGSLGARAVSPEDFDIRELIPLLNQVENLLFPTAKRDRPPISYGVESGSVKHIIRTSLQAILGFNAILGQFQGPELSLDFLEPPTARAFEFFSESAKKHDWNFEIFTSLDGSHSIGIDRTTKFTRAEDHWITTEFYFYGLVTDIGGKSDANVHLDTKEYGVIKVSAEKELLSSYKSNPLYKRYGLRAIGRQNLTTKEIDKASLKLVEIIDYDPKFNTNYLNELIGKASESWAGISDADDWLAQMR